MMSVPGSSDAAPYIAVVGRGEHERAAYELAEEIGRLLAEAGAVLVCGGLGGVMEAACKGAKSAGGTTIGFLPRTTRAEANAYVDFALATGMGEMRNMLVVQAADAVIAVSGEFGTLSEIGFALRVDKPVVGLQTWELSKAGAKSDAIRVADDPTEAVELALKLARTRG